MKISQRQARYYRKRTMELESILARQKHRWSLDWAPGWVNIEALILNDSAFAKVDTARKLGHAVVVSPGSKYNEIVFYAEKL
jgi:hypothetical protein